jgi:hypothetical protein
VHGRMIARPTLLLAALSLALVALPPGASAKTSIACVDTLLDPSVPCGAGFGPSCTSTSRCLGARATETGEFSECVNNVCTPWLPYCVAVQAWFESEPESPLVDEGGCLPIILGGGALALP